MLINNSISNTTNTVVSNSGLGIRVTSRFGRTLSTFISKYFHSEFQINTRRKQNFFHFLYRILLYRRPGQEIFDFVFIVLYREAEHRYYYVQND